MKDTARFVELQTSVRPRVGVVLGSGLGTWADSLINSVRIPYRDLPDFPVSTAEGHAGELVAGIVGANGRAAADVLVMSGRLHLYEGFSAREVTAPIRLFNEFGVRRVILTNAAGGIHPDFRKGSIVMLADHINLQGANPLIGAEPEIARSRFTDMTEAYSLDLRTIAMETARELHIPLHEGVYAGVLGPSYETPAEIRFLRAIGADLVGMSTVLETIAARNLGLEVLGLSFVTNAAAGMGPGLLEHSEVLAEGRRVSHALARLLTALVPKLA